MHEPIGMGFPNTADGTFTPTLLFGGASVGIVYAVQTGYYQKIGNKITISGNVSTSTKSSSTGPATIAGLPSFLPAHAFPVFMRLYVISYTGRPQAYSNGVNPPIINLQYLVEAGTTTSLTDANFSDNSSIIFTAEFFI